MGATGGGGAGGEAASVRVWACTGTMGSVRGDVVAAAVGGGIEISGGGEGCMSVGEGKDTTVGVAGSGVLRIGLGSEGWWCTNEGGECSEERRSTDSGEGICPVTVAIAWSWGMSGSWMTELMWWTGGVVRVRGSGRGDWITNVLGSQSNGTK